ncbi:MAG TPA: recombinase family protein [Pseudonocardiaceae bacterium]|nr:recombinase family protein [Pseudonocardiaceae bacterium]
MMEELPRAAAVYARISQDKAGAGLGVERQEADCRELATRLGWTVVEVFADNDLSAYSGKTRPRYRAMLEAIRAGRVGAVLAWHTDRLHRSPIELEEYITACNDGRDVPTHTVQAGPLDLSTPSGRMVARQLGAVARYESEHRSERVRRAFLQSAQQGRRHGGPRPFGYDDDGMTVREPEAAAVRAAVESVLAGASLRSVARDLTATGLTTTMKARAWDAHAVRALLLKPRNAGLRDHQGQVIGPASWPAIVPEEQWRAVVAILTDPARRTSPSDARVKWLGSGIYRCAGCERPTLRVSTAGRGIPCYRCPGEPGTTGHVTRVAGPLDAYIEAIVVERLCRPDAVELLRTSAPDVDLPGLRAAANAARARLAEIAEMLGEGELTRAEAQIARARASARLERAEAEIAGATAASPLAGLVDAPDPAALWAGLDIGRRRAVLDTLMTVTVLPVIRPGPRFDPDTVRIEPK